MFFGVVASSVIWEYVKLWTFPSMVSMGHCMVSVQFDLWSGRLESECTSWWSTEGSGVYHSAVMSWPYLRKSQNRDIEPKLLRNQSDVGRAALDSARKAQALTGQHSLQIHRTLNSANVKNYIGVGVRNGLLGFECVTSACFLYDAGLGVNHTQFLPVVSPRKTYDHQNRSTLSEKMLQSALSNLAYVHRRRMKSTQ